MTQKERMLAGLPYDACDPDLLREVARCRALLSQYNALLPSDIQGQQRILNLLFSQTNPVDTPKKLSAEPRTDIIIRPPFICDYGSQIHIGKRFFAAENLTILDEAIITIGDDVTIGPNVSIFTSCHPTNPSERNQWTVWSRPVTIGNGCRIGGSVTILPGSTIPANTIISPGTIVLPSSNFMES